MLKLLCLGDTKWSIAKIADSVKMSASETHAAIKRCSKSGLYSSINEKPNRVNLEEFILHGLKYVFPGEKGEPDRGLPTAHSTEPIASMLANKVNDLETLVWPYAFGNVRGVSVIPLYKTVPDAVMNDKKLYEFLALIDVLRVGRIREINIARDELIKRLREK